MPARGRLHRMPHGYGVSMFLFFNNRLGCLGSLLISLMVTALLIVILSR